MRNLLKAINGGKPFLVDYQLAQQHIDLKQKAGLTDLITQIFGEKPKPYVVGSTAVIPIFGMIGKGLSPLEAIGAADVETISDQIDAALASKPARIVFHIESDGGTVDGVEELADQIRSLPVETVAYGSNINSAAYWLASAADRLVVPGSGSVGSVGVFGVSVDSSEKAKANGLTVTVYRSDELKGIGVPGAPITEAQHNHLQASVMATAARFKADVMLKRKLVKESDLTGVSLTGREAAAKGMATGISPSIKALLTQLEGANAVAGKAKAIAAQKPAAQPRALKAAVDPAAPAQPETMAEPTPEPATESSPEPEEADGLNPRQRYLKDELEGMAETFGHFDQSSLANGSHYVAPSPFGAQGLACKNCVFYQGGRKCAVVAGDIDPEAICKLWVIPEKLVTETPAG